VAVTSDRGLCGGLNSNITKYTKALLAIYGKGEPQHRSLCSLPPGAHARPGGRWRAAAAAAGCECIERAVQLAAPQPRLTPAGNPNDKQLATIGDKGRSQLSRIEADRFVLNINETYKVKVTFPQVSCCWLPGAGAPGPTEGPTEAAGQRMSCPVTAAANLPPARCAC
jgi:hypothetical protein